MNQDLREQLWLRTRSYCDACGLPMGQREMAAHHRRLRSHGGRDEITNLLGVHHSCHNGSSNGIHLSPARAYAYGWLVSAYQEPETVPVFLHASRWVLLTPNGLYTRTTEPKEI